MVIFWWRPKMSAAWEFSPHNTVFLSKRVANAPYWFRPVTSSTASVIWQGWEKYCSHFFAQISHASSWLGLGPSRAGEFSTERIFIQKFFLLHVKVILVRLCKVILLQNTEFILLHVKVSRALAIGAIPFSPATKTSDIRKRCDTTIVDHRH